MILLGMTLMLLAFEALLPLYGQGYELVIRHGQIADGTGKMIFTADLAINQGRILQIGKIEGRGKEEIEAEGLVIAPGFIDVHTHAEDIAELPLAENFVRMGVTTIITGNCGSSPLSIGEFFQRLEATNVSVNVASLIGHNTVREKAMGGSFKRPPTSEEMKQMKALVERAFEEGAAGISTGLIYLPGTFAATDELIELAKTASAHEAIYVSHMRNEGVEIFAALDELFRIAREAKIRAQISHLKLSTRSAWGRARQVIEAIDQARSQGLQISHDQYVYTASSTSLNQLIPDWAREGDQLQERLQDPGEKMKIIAEMKAKLRQHGFDDYSYAVIAHYGRDVSLNGLNVVEAAGRKRGAQSLDDQIELILGIGANGGASAVFHSMNEADLRQFLKLSQTMFASDSGVRRFGEGVPHPRGYGNNARVLSRYVRDLKLLSLEEAIRRMSSLPAQIFRIKQRGLVREGYWADLVLFNPELLQDKATFESPHQYPVGIRTVFVNGVAVVQNGSHSGARPGKALRQLNRE